MLHRTITRVSRPRLYTLLAALGAAVGMCPATAHAQHRGGGHSGGGHSGGGHPPVVHRPPTTPHTGPHHNPHGPVVVGPHHHHVGPVVRPTVIVVRPHHIRPIGPVVVNPIPVTGDPIPVVTAPSPVTTEVAAAPVGTAPAGSTALMITGLADRGPASAGGLRQGHVIIKAGGTRIKTGDDLKAVAARGGQVEVLVYNTTSNQLEKATVALANGKFGVDYEEIAIELDETALADGNSKKGSG